tara:strand:- start:2264 stop:2689 length:426 start_codon:yes stop_codon:yes gene_type:complete
MSKSNTEVIIASPLNSKKAQMSFAYKLVSLVASEESVGVKYHEAMWACKNLINAQYHRGEATYTSIDFDKVKAFKKASQADKAYAPLMEAIRTELAAPVRRKNPPTPANVASYVQPSANVTPEIAQVISETIQRELAKLKL